MSASRLADLRARASAAQVVGLDVRGPVSEALGRAGIAVPPAPLADEPAETTVPDIAPTPAASSLGAKAAPRVVKPFDAAPWPTRKPHPAPPEPPATLSGLTADERRVHRILLDTLARTNTLDGVSDGLTYAEKKHLAALSLPYIDAEIERLKTRPAVSGLRWLLAVLAVGVSVPVLMAGGTETGPAGKLAFLLIGALCAVAFLRGLHKPSGSTQRLAIYQALRELALLADPDDVTSGALAQADAVIDRLAGADDAPRSRLDDASSTSASAGRTRSRS